MKQKDITYVPGFLELDVSKAVEKMGRSGASNLVMSAVRFLANFTYVILRVSRASTYSVFYILNRNIYIYIYVRMLLVMIFIY